MSIIVYWIQPSASEMFSEMSQPMCQTFKSIELAAALRFCQQKRNAGYQHVTLSSENEDSVGRPGVETVENGKLPDGQDYTWVKRRG